MNLTAAQRHSLTWLAIAAVCALLLWLMAPVLTPFLIGAVLSYVLHPLVERLAARRLPRLLAVGVVEVLVILALLALLLLMVPILSKELPLLREQVPLLVERVHASISPWLAQWGIKVSLDTASIKAFVLKNLNANFEDWFTALLSSARIGGSVLLAILGNALLVPVVLFYLLMDWPQWVERVRRLIPPRRLPAVSSFLQESDLVLGQYLRGQLLVMGILSIYYSVGLALLGLDLAVPVGVFTGMAIFIPYLGFGFGLILALLAAVLEFPGWYGVLGVAGIYGLGQVLESLYLTPRLVGERIGLSPLTVIFALLAFGHLFGFVGVLIALPVSAVLVVAVRRLRRLYIESHLYHQ